VRTFIDEDGRSIGSGIYANLRQCYTRITVSILGTDIFTSKGEVFSFSSTNDYFDLNLLALERKYVVP